ncbi:ABC transporter substrate-binding protein [Mycoplasma marinum]|uniref:ABC transporter substrate-binding protein n=1 Tax=Mycoplasma marinum TaxID=1937190 RepID=UPI001FE89E02|nr:ABC transporter substrate-binding protein [Mycoplasma marinum]
MKKIFTKVIIPITGAAAAISVLPLTLFISNKYSHKEKYDFGLAVPTINSLNYIKYDGPTSTVASSLMDGLFSHGPSGDLKSQLRLDPLSVELYHVDDGDGSVVSSSQSYEISDSGYTSSSVFLGKNSKSFIIIVNGQGLILDMFFRLNGKSKWRSGDKKWDEKNARVVQGSDYVDSAKAILNLKNGSQKIAKIRNLNIRGVNDVYNAQYEYYKKNKKIYPSPFDGKLRKDGTIGKSDFKLGVSSGMKSLKNEIVYNSKETSLDFVKSLVPENERDAKGEWANSIVHYSFAQPIDINTAIGEFERPGFLPINKKFIEDHGGIMHFGDSAKNFIWNGPFDINSLILGQRGSLTLKKSEKYFDEKHVIPNKIKLYFQEDEVIKGTLFDDGKISRTKVPSIYQMKFWSDLKKRRYMKKKSGYGTIALSLNLDKSTNSNSPLQDENLRKAISYAINREQMLRYAGWQTSFPVVKWTSFNSAKDTKSRNVETHWDVYKNSHNIWEGEVYKAGNGKKFPIENIDWQGHLSGTHMFEHSNRVDSGYDPETAKYYIDQYKKAHPNQKQVTLKFVDPSTPETRKIFIGLSNFFRRQFGDYVKLEEKSLPQNVFVQQQLTGNFDIIYGNYDKYDTTSGSAYIKRFLLPDGINKEQFKTTGFRNNPAGSWTYTTFKNKRKKQKTWDMLKDQLEISSKVWDKINELIPNAIPKNQDERQKIMDKFENFFIGEGGNFSDSFVAQTLAGFEKLIRESVPIIPLMEVDKEWDISRLMGASFGKSMSLKFAYDVDNKPRPNLPGLEED